MLMVIMFVEFFLLLVQFRVLNLVIRMNDYGY